MYGNGYSMAIVLDHRSTATSLTGNEDLCRSNHVCICLIMITGHLLVHVSWTCPQSNPDLRVTGYKVLVDGKQYGTTLHAGVKNVRIKLGLNQLSHRLSKYKMFSYTL